MIIDDERTFGYRLPDGTVVEVFAKVNPFEATPERVNTVLGEMPTSALAKTTGCVDNENEFTSWVEYRLIGHDEIIHRSADIKLKKALLGGAIPGGF